jgi:uncharacterized membrane protein
MPNDDKPPERQVPTLGVAIAMGAGVGAALFAATDSPVWIGVGVAMGAALGVTWNSGND